MSERIPRFLVMDMIDCVGKILEFIKDHSFEKFIADKRTYDAVIRNLEILGEAANRMPDYFMNEHVEIEWNKIIGTRNRIIHGYDSIDDKIIWDIVKNDLPNLKSKLESLLSRI